MSGGNALQHIRTHQHIRTVRSLRVNTGPGRYAWWPRLRETEYLVEEEKRRQKGRQLRLRRLACQKGA